MPIVSIAQKKFIESIARGQRKETNGITKAQAQEYLKETIATDLPQRKTPQTNFMPVRRHER